MKIIWDVPEHLEVTSPGRAFIDEAKSISIERPPIVATFLRIMLESPNHIQNGLYFHGMHVPQEDPNSLWSRLQSAIAVRNLGSLRYASVHDPNTANPRDIQGTRIGYFLVYDSLDTGRPWSIPEYYYSYPVDLRFIRGDKAAFSLLPKAELPIKIRRNSTKYLNHVNDSLSPLFRSTGEVIPK